MLYFLDMFKKNTPVEFQICPIYLDLGWQIDLSSLAEFCSSLNLSLLVKKTNIAQLVFEARQEKNPCSLCANLRRGALNRTAKNNSCNKLALGHHLDDAVNTLFMSMLYESRFHVFKPRTYLDRIDITVIRPLIYVEESEINLFINSSGFIPLENPCPADGFTKRDEIAQLLEQIETCYPGARKRFLASIENASADSFWQ
jgi:tRNA(Ile)-lysidine synthase TilS/MesJ